MQQTAESLPISAFHYIPPVYSIHIKYQSMSIAQRYNGVGIPTDIGIFDRALIMYDEEEANYLDARIKKEA